MDDGTEFVGVLRPGQSCRDFVAIFCNFQNSTVEPESASEASTKFVYMALAICLMLLLLLLTWKCWGRIIGCYNSLRRDVQVVGLNNPNYGADGVSNNVDDAQEGEPESDGDSDISIYTSPTAVRIIPSTLPVRVQPPRRVKALHCNACKDE
ncbi:unnamed protein product [Allacma fusca]|uniref:Uncharacterized protein n=1 Tax=Allacma fusca TaxID=39272 RepID=A0A8J2JJF0_9HEXA|nr:unnamed protein product [Allacma fusca]